MVIKGTTGDNPKALVVGAVVIIVVAVVVGVEYNTRFRNIA